MPGWVDDSHEHVTHAHRTRNRWLVTLVLAHLGFQVCLWNMLAQVRLARNGMTAFTFKAHIKNTDYESPIPRNCVLVQHKTDDDKQPWYLFWFHPYILKYSKTLLQGVRKIGVMPAMCEGNVSVEQYLKNIIANTKQPSGTHEPDAGHTATHPHPPGATATEFTTEVYDHYKNRLDNTHILTQDDFVDYFCVDVNFENINNAFAQYVTENTPPCCTIKKIVRDGRPTFTLRDFAGDLYAKNPNALCVFTFDIAPEQSDVYYLLFKMHNTHS